MFWEYLDLSGYSLANENKVKILVELREKLSISYFLFAFLVGSVFVVCG